METAVMAETPIAMPTASLATATPPPSPTAFEPFRSDAAVGASTSSDVTVGTVDELKIAIVNANNNPGVPHSPPVTLVKSA
jgi:hypothetical protein